MTFGARLTEARKRKGLTQQALGKGLATDGEDASKSVVYGWEKDQHFPRVDQLAMICEKLSCSSDYLLFGQVSEADLLPEIADLASAINQLPPPQRKWVVSVVQNTIEAAKTTIPVMVNDVTAPAPDEASRSETLPAKRMSRG